MGMIRRDSNGYILGLAINFLPHKISPKMAEALASKRTIQTARERRFSHFILETNYLQLAQAWKSKRALNPTYFDDVLEDCRYVSRGVVNFKILFVKRLGNKVVESLAKLALDTREKYWLDDLLT